MVELAYNQCAPGDPDQMPARLRIGWDEYRRGKQTQRNIFCLFGRLRLRRWLYQPLEAGEKSVFPLELSLGIVDHLATPALADQLGRLSADLTQQQTRDVLAERYNVAISVGSLRRVAATVAEQLIPFRQECQVDCLTHWLNKAFDSDGPHHPSLVVGRDGVMMPMRPFWEEASTATVSVYDRMGKRLGTVYLGQMPQSGQATMNRQLTGLLNELFVQWPAELPRLHYVTDAGHHPQDYFRRVLKKMRHPRTAERLSWTWCVDYYHVAERISTLADGLFGCPREAASWSTKMRKILKNKPAGISRLIRSAAALARHRGIGGNQKDFHTAMNFLKKYRWWMNYAELQSQGLAIGSGVTEAACKTIIGYRFKQSGMRWKKATGQHILDLRVMKKSRIWRSAFDRWLNQALPYKFAKPKKIEPEPNELPRNYPLAA